ncbi:MAG: class I SAM-dependent methyltransferase [Bacteroidota bacterium]
MSKRPSPFYSQLEPMPVHQLDLPASTEDVPALNCPVCGSANELDVVELTGLPVFCNVLHATEDAAKNATRGDLQLRYCWACEHVFNVAFDASLMDYDIAYENSLHYSPRFEQFAQTLASRLIETYDIRGRHVVEIGIGKGDFMRMLCEQGGNHGLGFDPSFQPELVGEVPFEVVRDYYDPTYAHVPADLVVCRHVLEHIEQPTDMLRGLRETLGSRHDTIVYIEVPNVRYTLEEGGVWDLIYEHCGYFSAASLRFALESTGFEVLRLEESFGGQYLSVDARPAEHVTPRATERVLADAVAGFSGQLNDVLDTHQRVLDELRANGQTAVVWGAGSKGVTMINLLDGAGIITALVDINPRKQGRFAPGAGLPVVSPDALTELKPDVVFVVNGLYRDEIAGMLAERGIEADLHVV